MVIGLGLAMAAAALAVSGLTRSERPAIVRPPHHSGPVQPPAEMLAAAGNQTLITPRQAEAVVRAWWAVAEPALAQNDTLATDAVETGPAAEYNDAVTQDNLVRGGNLRTARSLQAVEVSVPALRQYPGYFFASALTSTYASASSSAEARVPYQEFLVFVRPSAAEPWKLALQTGGNGGAWPPFPPASDQGTEYDQQPTDHYLLDPTTVPGFVANYRTRYIANGRRQQVSNAVVDSGFWADTQLQQVLGGIRNSSSQSMVERWTYAADVARDGFYQFATISGGNLVCFVNRYQRQLSGLGRTINQDRARDSWGSWLAPGDYRSITLDGLQQTCALDPRSGAGLVKLYGGNGGTVGATGQP